MSKLQLLSYDTFLELSSRKQYDVYMLEHQRAEGLLYTIEELQEDIERLSEKDKHEHISTGG